MKDFIEIYKFVGLLEHGIDREVAHPNCFNQPWFMVYPYINCLEMVY